ncbi:terminase small subunit protein [Stenotrophomonas sp.]|uniref:terminase small subunit-like protein n=1 Tax=Stenotrophomonas sp. TaxID=69392 RepID=UPI0028A1BBEE|nr:terminase small subunit protein [Stenotrophomonas sp.]
MANLICERIADGESLKAICAEEHMPGRATVFRWLSAHETFRDMYAHAREEQAETLADEIVGIADEQCTMVRADKHSSSDDDGEGNTEVVFDSTAVARNRLRVDARKWVAAKLKPRKFSDRIQQEHSGPGGGPIEVEVVTKVVVAGVEPKE